MKDEHARPLHVLARLLLGLTLLLGLSVLAAGSSLVAHAQSAATTTVSTCDEGHLDAAISSANSGDTINFSCSGDIALTQTLTITKNLTLDGSGQNITLDGQNSVMVLSVNSGVSFTLNTLTIAHGIGYNSGGLYNNGGTVSISNSTFANNSAGLPEQGTSGGGLNNASGTVSISNSTFTNNSTGFGGPTGLGGGLFNGGTLNITNSTIVNNQAVAGGGLFNSGTVSITNSTITKNSASYPGYGGGLDNSGLNGPGKVGISNSIVANNSNVANNSTGDCHGPVTDQGYNLESSSDCGFTSTGSMQNTDPKLDPNGLQNNGGPTQTIALQQGSPAIDQIPVASCPTTDQRGMTRPDNKETTCDIGAYEFYDAVDDDLALTNVPANITTNATSSQGAVVTYTPPTVVDEDNPLPSVTCTPASGSTFAIGTTTVTCTVSDSDDSNSPVSATFTVTVQPVFSATGSNITATEGSSFSGVVATGTAYGATSPLSATINWGDGSTPSTGSVTLNADGSYSVSGSHTYAEEGSYTISVMVKDSGSLSATGTGSAKVADAALTLTVFAASALPHHSAGLAATFTDADPAGQVSDYTATVTWGDGTTSTVKAVKNPVGKGFALAAAHSYSKAGTYTLTLTVTDQGGSQVSKTVTLTVK